MHRDAVDRIRRIVVSCRNKTLNRLWENGIRSISELRRPAHVATRCSSSAADHVAERMVARFSRCFTVGPTEVCVAGTCPGSGSWGGVDLCSLQTDQHPIGRTCGKVVVGVKNSSICATNRHSEPDRQYAVGEIDEHLVDFCGLVDVDDDRGMIDSRLLLARPARRLELLADSVQSFRFPRWLRPLCNYLVRAN